MCWDRVACHRADLEAAGPFTFNAESPWYACSLQGVQGADAAGGGACPEDHVPVQDEDHPVRPFLLTRPSPEAHECLDDCITLQSPNPRLMDWVRRLCHTASAKELPINAR